MIFDNNETRLQKKIEKVKTEKQLTAIIEKAKLDLTRYLAACKMPETEAAQEVFFTIGCKWASGVSDIIQTDCINRITDPQKLYELICSGACIVPMKLFAISRLNSRELLEAITREGYNVVEQVKDAAASKIRGSIL